MIVNLVYQTKETEAMKSIVRVPDFKSTEKAAAFFQRIDDPNITKAWIENPKNLMKLNTLK